MTLLATIGMIIDLRVTGRTFHSGSLIRIFDGLLLGKTIIKGRRRLNSYFP